MQTESIETASIVDETVVERRETTVLIPADELSDSLVETWILRAIEVCEQARAGHLEMRMLGLPEHVQIRRLGNAINGLLDVVDAYVREAGASLIYASSGKYFRRVLLRGLRNSFKTGATIINQSTSAMAEKAELLQQAERRKLEIASELESAVQSVVASLASSATELEATADSLAGNAASTSSQVGQVLNASEQSATSVSTIAAAAEELSTSVSEINKQVQDSTIVARSAVGDADRAKSIMDGLSQASTKIGGVMKLITQIASQTNLLALNATIEAARAGDAGRGFAVVASEVKNLARQTSEATENITGEISSIQAATQEAVQAIGDVGATINKMDQISNTISTSVSEQRTATNEISKTVQNAAVSAQAVTASISEVRKATDETSSAVTQVLAAARELSAQAESLRVTVEKCVSGIRC